VEFGLVRVSLLYTSHQLVKIFILKHGMYLPLWNTPFGADLKDAINYSTFLIKNQ
jgi:hypothetical protein